MVGLKTQHELAKAYQTYESFRLVAAEALGGGKSGSAPPTEQPIQTMNELVAKFSAFGGKVGG